MSLSNRTLRPALLPGLFLAGLLAGCGGAAEKPEETPPAPVQVVKAQLVKRLEQWTELPGTTQAVPDQAGLVSTPVDGQVLWVLGDEGKGPRFHEGQWVKKNDVIVQLNDRVLRANAARLEAGLRKLADQKKQADLDIQTAQIAVQQLQNLKAQKIPVAPSEQQKADLALQGSRLKRQAIETDEKASQEELKALQAQIAQYSLRAPIDGRLGRVEVVPGQSLSIGTRVAEVVNLSKQIDVLCHVPPAAIGRVQTGQPADLVLTEGPSPRAPRGQVVFRGEQAMPDTGNFPVKVRFPNADLKMLANQVVWVRVQTQVKENALTVPETAVLEDVEPPQVVVVVARKEKDEEKGEEKTVSRAYRLNVKLGIRDRANHTIEIEAIPATELPDEKNPGKVPALKDLEFVVQGAQGLENGDEVKVGEEKKEEKD